ncbi:MAG: hypothetical protein JW938_02665, partial [Candidatus Omnitrophica bacterium]|nr:hypothetical protein [Candidatus Omnitrophota bacterium]
ITLLLAYQSLFGHVYSALALLIACYMAGLIMGSVVFTRIFAVLKNISFEKLLPICSAFMALFCLTIMAYFISFDRVAASLRSPHLFYLFIFIAGEIGGIQFVITNAYYLNTQTKSDNKMGNIYGSDMIGSALGALITSLILIPIYGLSHALFALAILNASAAAFIGIRSRR